MASISTQNRGETDANNSIKSINNNRLYLYLFHLFESVISNVAQLVNKTMQQTLSQCGESVNLNAINSEIAKESKRKNTISETINTIATGSELITKDDKQSGFFSENAKLISKSSQSIEKAVK